MRHCCCDMFSLRDGTIIIAIIALFCAILGVVLLGYSVGVIRTELDKHDKPKSADDDLDEDLYLVPDGYVDSLRFAYAQYLVYIVLFAIELVLVLGLLLGGLKNKETLCIPWYYYNLFLFAVGTFAAIIMAFYIMIKIGMLAGFYNLTFIIFYAMIRWYFLSVVREFIWQARDTKHDKNDPRMVSRY